MATMEQVRSWLASEEPNYLEAATVLGPAALPLLDELIARDDFALGPKATSLAALIRDPAAEAVVMRAAISPNVMLRVAAAAAARHLGDPAASRVLLSVIGDEDDSLRKIAMYSVGPDASAPLRERVADLAIHDRADYVRSAASHALAYQVNPGIYVNYDPPGLDVHNEYAVVRNNGDTDLELVGWTLVDAAHHVFRFPSLSLAPGQEVKVWTGSGADDATNLHAGRSRAVWNNRGDTARLLDAQGANISVFAYPGHR
jgi:hypothetical protein